MRYLIKLIVPSIKPTETCILSNQLVRSSPDKAVLRKRNKSRKTDITYEKITMLMPFMDKYRMLQMLFRVCVEQRVIDERQYAGFALVLDKIGRQGTSWKQYNEKGKLKNENNKQRQ